MHFADRQASVVWEPFRSVQTAAGNTPAKVVNFTLPKRARGRPRKPNVRKQPELQTPSSADFDHTRMAIAGIDKRVWVGAQKLAIRWVSQDPRVPGYALKVFLHQVYGINRTSARQHERGKCWHGETRIANEAGVAPRSVRAAQEILQLCGAMLRRHVIKQGSYSSKHWETTLPILVDAALEVARENEERKQKKVGAEERKERHKKEGVEAQKIPGAAAPECPLILKQNPEREPRAPPAGVYKQGPQEKVSGTVEHRSEAVQQLIGNALSRGQPRYNKSLPMAERVTTWRVKPPENQDDAKLQRTLLRASKGADLEKLKAQYCGWIEGANKDRPHDAEAAFVGWVDATSQRRRTSPGHY